MHLLSYRLAMLLCAGVLGYFFIIAKVLQWRTDYWVLEDGKPSTALITGEHTHGVVDYEYQVEQKKYTGRSIRNWKKEKYRNVGLGGKSVVYVSVSHPWLSALDRPDVVGVGWPVMLVAIPIEFFLVMTAINPKGVWALRNDIGKTMKKEANQ